MLVGSNAKATLSGSNTKFKATPGFKGEKGDSAYQVAVRNGFIGTEKDWLATLGTTYYVGETKSVILANVGQTGFPMPAGYTDKSIVEVYIEGEKLNADEYVIEEYRGEYWVTFSNPMETSITVEGTRVEIVILNMASNQFPIGETIDENSTNETAPGTKAVYDFIKASINEVAVITGQTGAVAPQTGPVIDVAYPPGFEKGNTIIIGKMVSTNNVYYDSTDLINTANGYPEISRVALTDEVIRIWVVNTSTTTAKQGYYKITLMKIN